MKIICVGRNYSEHAKELNNDIPKDPVIFMKPKSALLLPDKPLYYPEFTDELHYECELVVKICKNGKYIQEKFAPKYYKEISVGIDFTARDLQKQLKEKGLPWEIAKAFDSSAAVGDFLSIEDGLDINNIDFELKKNDETVQKGNSKDMLFPINEVIEYVSQYFTLNIGDLIFTGTPAGVGPTTIFDKLTGYLNGQQLLSVEVK